MKPLLVREWMRTNPLAVEPQTSLRAARKRIQDHRVRCLPVLQEGKLLGLAMCHELMDLDLLEMYYLSKNTVAEVMTKEVVVTTPDAPLLEAARTLLRYELEALPVMEGGNLVGLLSQREVLRGLLTAVDAQAMALAA
ncbi:MAG TPA: CBS domain-containing protein [Candidatus Methylomirabilis sp.]|nr:CBS domain-containing protein [Candidatus Methylomirabilis sp.]